ncbi:MAG: hypothetical protein WBA12_03450, partial [Catalinimonas sp.]
MQDSNNPLDDLFARRLGDHAQSPAPHVWNRLEADLDAALPLKRRPAYYWWAAAVLLPLVAYLSYRAADVPADAPLLGAVMTDTVRVEVAPQLLVARVEPMEKTAPPTPSTAPSTPTVRPSAPLPTQTLVAEAHGTAPAAAEAQTLPEPMPTVVPATALASNGEAAAETATKPHPLVVQIRPGKSAPAPSAFAQADDEPRSVLERLR